MLTSAPEPEIEKQPPLPAVYEHACVVYRTMEEEAKLVRLEDDSSELVWEGHLTKLFTQQLRLSVPYYTSVTRELKRMGCIYQKRRGGGSAPSQWVLQHEPTEDLFRGDANRSRYTTTRRQTKLQMMEQQLREVLPRVAKIEADYDIIIDLLQEREATNG